MGPRIYTTTSYSTEMAVVNPNVCSRFRALEVFQKRWYPAEPHKLKEVIGDLIVGQLL